VTAGRRVREELRDQLPDDVAVNVRQPEVATLRAEREFLVVEAEEGKDRGVQVVDMHRLLRRGKSKFVGRAVDAPPPASHRVKP
jgi:hypothetical protein